MVNINQEHKLIWIAMRRILTRLLDCYITNILVRNAKKQWVQLHAW